MGVKVTAEGFLTYEDTLFFKEGVFDYAGCEIDPGGKVFGLDQKKLYKVYRPKEEVTNPDFIATLNAKPLIDDHTIIGNGSGLVAPERKNCAGVLTDVKVVGNELHGRIDVWSTKMIDRIKKGKRELSLAYGCTYRKQMGVYNGQCYDFVQSGLRAGNHLALVDEARNGHDCRVVDCAFVCDAKFQLEQPDMDWTKISADELIEGLKNCSDECKAKAKEFLNTPTEDELKKAEEEKKAKEAADAEAAKKAEEEAKAKEAADAEAAKKAEEEKAAAEAKAEEDKATACADAAKKAVEEYKKVIELAADCKAKGFGTVALDGIVTEKDLAVKVCALDAAPAFLKTAKPDDAVTALKGYLSAKGVDKTAVTRVGDSAATGKMSVADYMKSR